MTQVSDAQRQSYKKYYENNKKKFDKYHKKYKKIKNDAIVVKHINYINLIKEYGKTMSYKAIASELQKQIPNIITSMGEIKKFCAIKNIQCATKQSKKPRLILTPEQRIIARRERSKKYYHQNKQKILVEKKKKHKKAHIIKPAIKSKVIKDKDQNLIDKIKEIAENNCVLAENIADLNIPSNKIESICKRIGYFYIKPDIEPLEPELKEKKIKVKKQSKLMSIFDQIKIEAEKSTIPEMAKIFEVHPATLYIFCKNHKIKTVKTVRSQHKLAKERSEAVYKMLKNGVYVEDIMKELNITYKQYYNCIYRVARNNNLINSMKFYDKYQFDTNKTEEIKTYKQEFIKPIINNTLEFSEDNSRFIIRNTQMRFR